MQSDDCAGKHLSSIAQYQERIGPIGGEEFGKTVDALSNAVGHRCASASFDVDWHATYDPNASSLYLFPGVTEQRREMHPRYNDPRQNSPTCLKLKQCRANEPEVCPCARHIKDLAH